MRRIRMTTEGLGATCVVLAVVSACLARYLGPGQVDFMNRFWRTALTTRAARLFTLAYYVVAVALAILGIGLVLVGDDSSS